MNWCKTKGLTPSAIRAMLEKALGDGTANS